MGAPQHQRLEGLVVLKVACAEHHAQVLQPVVQGVVVDVVDVLVVSEPASERIFHEGAVQWNHATLDTDGQVAAQRQAGGGLEARREIARMELMNWPAGVALGLGS